MQNVKIVGGYVQGDEDSKGAVFIPKKTVVVARDKVGTYFSRDWEMRAMPSVRLQNTNEPVTVHL